MGIGKLLGGLVAIVSIMASVDDAAAQVPGGGRGGRPSFDRLLDAFDANTDKALTEDEVPGRVWARLSQAGKGPGLQSMEGTTDEQQAMLQKHHLGDSVDISSRGVRAGQGSGINTCQ